MQTNEKYFSESSPKFSLSKYYQDHMVLQRGFKTSVWGKSSAVGDHVNLLLDGSVVATGIVGNDNVWQMVFKPPNNPGPHVLTASSSLGNVTINDVLFGDVWMCSGQSNMEYMTLGLQNATEEYKDAVNYPNIRLFKLDHAAAATPLQELTKVAQVWNKASEGTIKFFSAVCWLYGKYLSQHLNRPIGLVESVMGDAPIRSWSSSDALLKCPTLTGKRYETINQR
ncbi:hypothetical protein FSP39_022767 [Pinctada imbricata]|uniref:Sialate O-acetylesterase domain-containing protein n=1 Tax=Pinctada imbricata TaxID=66713 RepID=A0AA88YCI6_PINIB|nr:hypothetical protein FSP39_022767 [Pinctada imbricata]